MLVKCVGSHGVPPSTAREWRSKAKNEQLSHEPPQASPTPLASSLISPKFASKVVTTDRKINFWFLANKGFFIGDQLKDMSWRYLFSLDLPTCLNLVKEFYSTLARGSNRFVCKLRGKEINIIANLIGHILDMSIEGDAPTIHCERELLSNLF